MEIITIILTASITLLIEEEILIKQRILLTIFDEQTSEEISFVERGLGDSGRDILAVKVALGVLTNSENIVNGSPQDFSIGQNWFDCETGREVSSTMGIILDEKTKNKLMNYQIQNQFVILSYYFEKYGLRNIKTKQDMLAQIIQAERIFESEFGNIGEGTLHTLHGWVPDADLTSTGYYQAAEIEQQVPMFFSQGLLDESIAMPDRVKSFFYPFPDQTPPPWYERSKRDFKKFYRSQRDLANKLDEIMGIAIYNPTELKSQLFSGAEQVFQAIAEQPRKQLDDMSAREIEALTARAFEPDPKTDPEPFIINTKKIGAFVRTSFNLDNLPKELSAEQVASLKLSAIQKAAIRFSKSLESSLQSEIESKIEFVDMRAPSLRPGDVYRAYFEIDKQWLDSLPRTTQSVANQETLDSLSSALATSTAEKLEQTQKILEDLYCADGADFSDEEAAVQYRKYRAFAAKNKREIVRSLRDAAQKSLANQEEVGNNFSFDLGVFGPAGKYSDTEIINSVFNLGLSGIDALIGPQESKSAGRLAITFSDLRMEVDNASKNLREAAPDIDNYKFEGNLAFNSSTVLQEADKLSRIPDVVLDLLKKNTDVVRAVQPTGKTVEEFFSPGIFKSNIRIQAPFGIEQATSFDVPEIVFDFTDAGGTAELRKIQARIPVGGSFKLVELSFTAVRNSFDVTTSHYLRNVAAMASNFSGALCNQLGGTQAGLGARFVIKYRRPKQNATTNPFSDVVHSYKIPVVGQVKDYIEKTKESAKTYKDGASKKGRPNVTAYDVLEATRVVPVNFELSQVLPLIGDNCTFAELADLLGKNLEKLLCNYIECLRLPGIQVKAPDINLDIPVLPKLPTFNGFFDFNGKKILDQLIDIVTRLFCRLAKKLLNVLATPFCGDELIEGLFGASSTEVSPAVKRALADSIIDLGVPKEQYGSLGDYIDDISKFLTPRELCILFQEGTYTLEVEQILNRLSENYGLLEYIAEPVQKYNLFTGIGIFLDPELCNQLQGYNDILGRYDCSDTSDLLSRIRNRIARNEEVSQEEIDNAISNAEENMMDTSMAIEALINGEGLAAAIGSDMLDPTNPNGLINLTPPFVIEGAKETADLIFETARMSYHSSLKNFVPSMYLRVPGNAEPGDPNYDARAVMIVQRHTSNLQRYAEKVSESQEMEGQALLVSQLLEALATLKVLYYDYVIEDFEGNIIEDVGEYSQEENNFKYKTETVEIDGEEVQQPVLKTGEFGFPVVLNNEFYPVMLSTLPLDSEDNLLLPFLAIKNDDRYRDFISVLNSVSDAILGDYLEDINSLIQARLDVMRLEIEQNLEGAFRITEKSKFLSIINEFYNVELEQEREGTELELIDYRNDENALVLLEPSGMRFESNVIMRDLKSNSKRIPYYISIKDELFLQKSALFNYCQEIPEEYEIYGNLLEDEYPRKSLFSQIYLDNLTEKVLNYRTQEDPEIDLGSFGLTAQDPAGIYTELYNTIYASTVEGTVEQIVSFLSKSRLFSDEDYRARMDRILRGNSYYDPVKGCIKNKFNLVGLSEISFSKAIIYDFEKEFRLESSSNLENPLYIDPSKPKPIERAIANVVVRGFFRTCILEVLLKGAVSFSVWDLEFLIDDNFFKDYMFEYVSSEIERNQTFTEYKEEFENALIRTSKRSNKYLAIKSILSEELAKFPKFSKVLYDHDSTIEHKNWFSSVTPLVDTPQHGSMEHAVSFEDLSIKENCFSHFERYIRLAGPLANPTSLAAARYSQAEESSANIVNKLRDTNFDKQNMPKVEDYIVTPESPELVPFADARPNSEFLSPKEFEFLIQEVLFGDESLNRFFSDLLNLVGPEQTSRKFLHQLPRAISNTPARAIKRARRFISFEDFDPVSSNGGTYFQNLYENSSADSQTYKELLSSSTTEEEDRYYIVPIDTYQYWNTRASDSFDIDNYQSFKQSAPASGNKFFDDNFLFSNEKVRILAEPYKSDASLVDAASPPGKRTMFDRITKSSQEGKTEGRGITLSEQDPLSPDAPWNLRPRTSEDVVTKTFNPGVQGSERIDILFNNAYGEVSEEQWQTHVSSIQNAQQETWQETVIDFKLSAAPIFNLVGESEEPLKDTPLPDASSYLRLVLSYLVPDEQGKVKQPLGEDTIREELPIIRFEEGSESPILARGLGYEEEQNYRVETLFNKPSANKDSSGRWSIGTDSNNQVLARNQYKIPVRILVTQILDSNGNVTATFVNCNIPKILDFNSEEQDSARKTLLTRALLKICQDFDESIQESYTALKMGRSVSEDEAASVEDADESAEVLRQRKYDLVKRKISNFPVFYRTKNNTLPNDERDGFLSTSKLYSVAAALEASDASENGNFSLSQRDVDAQFSNRGMLVKSKEVIPTIDLRARMRQIVTPALEFHYSGPVRNFSSFGVRRDRIRFHRNQLLRARSDNFNGSATAGQLALLASTDNRTDEAAATILYERELAELIDECNQRRDEAVNKETEHMVRQKFIASNNFYQLNGLHSILDSNTANENHGATLVSLSNIITWFSQRRSEGLWGKTFNIRDQELNRDNFRLYKAHLPVGPADLPGVHLGPAQLPVEAPFHMAGNSMFYADGRTFDWQITETLYDSFQIDSSSKTEYAKLESYRSFVKALTILRNSVYMHNRYFKFAFGDSYPDSKMYKEQYVNFANELMPSSKDFRYRLDELVELHRDRGIVDSNVSLGEAGGILTGTEAAAVELALSDIIRGTYYQGALSSEAPSFVNFVKDENTIADLLTENHFLKRLRESNPFNELGELPEEPVIKFLFGNKNRKVIEEVKSQIYGGLSSRYVELQYKNIQSVRDSYKDMRERYNAALGPAGLDVLQDMIDILAAYVDNDADGSSKIVNAVRATTIKQGLRLVHTIPKSAVPGQVWTKFENTELSTGELPWNLEERLGLRWRPSPSETTYDLNTYCAVIAEEERVIESLECWGLGSTLLDKIYDFDEFMLSKVTQNMNYKAYSEICFPAKQYCSLLTVHGTALLGGYNTMPAVLSSTKLLLSDIIQIVAIGTGTVEDVFGSNFSNTELKNMLDEALTSQGLDPCFDAPSLGKWGRIVREMVEEMVKRFPALVLRGIAEQVDPASREIKRHWLACDMDNFAFSGPYGGSVLTFATGKRSTPLGVKKPGSSDAEYAPVNFAFPVDLALGISRLLATFGRDKQTLFRSISKFVGFLQKGSQPFLDPSYAFKVPCKDIDFSGENAFGWDKFKFGQHGRYGQPATIFTLAAFLTDVLPGDARQKQELCIVNQDQITNQACEDEEE